MEKMSPHISHIELAMEKIAISNTDTTSPTTLKSIDWASCIKPYSLNESAFQYAGPRSKNYWKNKVVKVLTSISTFEQQRLVLDASLMDPRIINISSSIGVNLEEAKLHQDIIANMRRYFHRLKLKKGGGGDTQMTNRQP